MTGGIFDVGVGDMMASNVTPQQPVSQTSSLEVFSPVIAQTTSSALPAYAKAAKQDREDATNTILSGFSRKMAAIADDTVINGTSPERAMMQARRLYSQAQASHPYLSKDLDQAFTRFFSGPLGSAATKGSEQYQFENKLIAGAADWITPDMSRDQQLAVAKLKGNNAVWKEANQNLILQRKVMDLDSGNPLQDARLEGQMLKNEETRLSIEKRGYELQSIRTVESQDMNYYTNGFKAKVDGFKSRIRSGEASTIDGKVKLRAEMVDLERSISAELDQQGKFMSPTARAATMNKYKAALSVLDGAINNPQLQSSMDEEIKLKETSARWEMVQDDETRRIFAASKMFPNTDIVTLAGNTVAERFLGKIVGPAKPVDVLSKDGKQGLSAIHRSYIQPNLRLLNSGQGFKTPNELEAAKKEMVDAISSVMMGTNAYSDSIDDSEKSTSNYTAVLDMMGDPELQKFIQDNKTIFPAKVVNKFQQTIEAEYVNKNYGIINAKLDGISVHTGQGMFQLATKGPQFTYNLRDDVEPVLIGSSIKFVAKEGKSVKWEALESLNTQLASRLNRILSIDKAFSGDSYDKIFSTRIAPQIGYGKKKAEEPKK